MPGLNHGQDRKVIQCGSRHALNWRLLLCAGLIAVISPLPYAGSWNDGSRLASVESLVDYHTWQIDQSIFVRTPGHAPPRTLSAYPGNDTNLLEHGTLDKLYIRGHYYSDKSPVPSLLMAVVYKLIQVTTGLRAANSPALYCYLLTLLFSGSAFVISAACMDKVASIISLTCASRLLAAYSFAIATIALPYVREVNNHILLLAIFSSVILCALKYMQAGDGKSLTWHLPLMGFLTGLGYTTDLGAGPILVLSVIGFIWLQTHSLKALFLVLVSSFPWFLLHHILNFVIGGTFKPANAVSDYFLWPGSPFNLTNLTGGWAHKTASHFLIYSMDLLFGKKGFIGHNLPLFLSVPALMFFFRNRVKEAPVIWLSSSMIVGTWLIYSSTSNNYSGVCCSVRWFVPLLAPFYFLLIVFLKYRSDFTVDLAILSAWGLVLSILMWIHGPWMPHMVPGYWFIQAGALITWLGYRRLWIRNPVSFAPPPPDR